MDELHSDTSGQAPAEQLVTRLLDAVSVPVFLKTRDGRYVFANSILKERTAAGDRFLGCTVSEIIAQEDAAETIAEDERAWRGEKIVARRVVHTHHREITYLITKQLLRDTPYGDVLLGCMHDLAPFDRIQAELHQERDFVSAVLQVAGALVVVLDTEGRIVRANRACERVTGYSFQELEGRLLWEVFKDREEERNLSRQRLEAMLSKCSATAFEAEWLTKSGEHRRISFSNTVLTAEEGRSRNVVCTGIDITDQYRTQEKQLKSELQLRTLWQASQDPLCLADEQGTIVRANPAFAQLVGVPLASLEGTNIVALFPPNDQDAARQGFAEQFIRRAAQSHVETELHFPHGRSGVFDISVTPIQGPGQAPQVLGIFHDVTERKRMIERAQTLNAAKNEFLGNISHEIRTPLNGILGMATLALGTELPSEAREYIELLKVSAEALQDIVNDVLAYSKYEAGKLALEHGEFSVRDLVREVVTPLAALASAKNVGFEYSIDPEVPDQLIGDGVRLRQILVKLAGNAVKFTSAGRISVRASRESIKADDVTLHFTVADTGIGIPAEKHRQIFEPFTQADSSTTRKYGGTGLGLSIAAGLVELMQGRIWLESIPGQGSTFHFTAALKTVPPKPPPHAVGANPWEGLNREMSLVPE